MASSNVKIDFSEYSAFLELLKKAGGGDFNRELTTFLEGLGYEFLRVLEDEIIRRKVMDTRLLLQSFHKSSKNNVWTAKGSGKNISLEVGTNLDYAGYVNDGHWANKQGVLTRFVPGVWQGDRFIYQKGAKTGMVLRQQWIEGSHYWEAALKILEHIYPKLLAKKVDDWMKQYFREFL